MEATRLFATALILLGLCSNVVSVNASSAGGDLIQPANNQLDNQSSLQRGARNYMSYCVGCHSLKYVRYNRLSQDLGLSEIQLKENLIFGVDKINQNVTTALTEEQASDWFNAVPPDLSLSARARGVDWIYSYLKSFYLDENRTFGVNNKILEGSSMPHVLWQLQGSQKAVYRDETMMDDSGKENVVKVFDHFEQVEPGSLSAAEYDDFVRDTVNFLDYVGEPMKLKRQKIGFIVMGFLALLTVLSYALKIEYWKDIH